MASPSPREFLRHWRTGDSPGTTGWHGDVRLGPIQMGFHVYRHASRSFAERWVFQPFLIFDRRAK